ncbi:MAG: glycosyltransferase family 39 protein [Candidatus Hydrogenedentes bacterium]|nr:glycosyltransferase family 39 protein [Candidatus Hydrogenedentota bacterium]
MTELPETAPPTTHREPGDGLPLREILLLLGILAVAAGLRNLHISSESLWHDEVASVQYLDVPAFTQFIQQERLIDPATVPVYFWLEYQWWHRVSASETGLRALSVLFGMLTVFLIWHTGRTLFGSACGLFAAWCLAFAHLHIYQSQEIRMYALMYLLALASMLAIHQAVTKNRPSWWAAHFITSALLVWTHVLGILVLAAQGLWLLWTWRRSPLRIVGWGAAQLPYLLPLAVWILGFDKELVNEHVGWQQAPGLNVLAKTFCAVLPGAFLDADPALWRFSIVGLSSLAVGALVWASALWALATDGKHTSPEEANADGTDTGVRPLLLMVLWCVTPVLSLFFVSITLRPCFVERYFAHCAFPLLLVAGAGFARMPRHWRLGVIAAVTLAFAGTLGAMDRPLRPDMRRAAHHVNAQLRDNESVYLRDPFNTGLAFCYYAALPDDRVVIDEDFVDLALRDIKEGRGAWIVHTPIGKRIQRTFKEGAEQAGMRLDVVLLPGRRPITLLHAARPSKAARGEDDSRSSASPAE